MTEKRGRKVKIYTPEEEEARKIAAENIRPVGRPKVYETEEERIAARRASWRKSRQVNKEEKYAYLLEWRARNRDHVNELQRKYLEQKRNKLVE